MAKLDLSLPSYMGRGILTGLTSEGYPADIYFIEGRSPPSRRRRLVAYPHEGRVHVDINSETTLEEMIGSGGNPKLLLYDTILGNPSGLLVVSNGFQTNHDAVWNGRVKEKKNLVNTKQ